MNPSCPSAYVPHACFLQPPNRSEPNLEFLRNYEPNGLKKENSHPLTSTTGSVASCAREFKSNLRVAVFLHTGPFLLSHPQKRMKHHFLVRAAICYISLHNKFSCYLLQLMKFE